MGDGTADLEAAGLYDPEAPDAAERLELLEHLLARGASIELIQRRLEGGDELFMVATSLGHEWPPVRSVREVAEAAGVDAEAVARMRLALGFPVGDLDERTVRFTLPDDLALFAFAESLFGDEAVLAFTRVMGATASRLADAANALFGQQVGEDGTLPSLLELSNANELAITALERVPDLLGRAILEHLGATVRRLPELAHDQVRCAIGFVDLVGSTAWASQVTTTEHTRALARFEAAAWDAATRHRGRLVKMIGDEAMFVANDADAVARVALELCRSVDADPVLPPARGALGEGELSTRDGDYFGPLVNTVARATKAGGPGEVVAVAPSDAALRAAGWATDEPAAVELRGVDAPVTVARILGPEPRPSGGPTG